jgi:dephospho-CoA kinase
VSAEQRRWVLGGGLASGKSQVRRILEAHGIHTIDADAVGHAMISPDGPAFEDVVRRWPQVVRAGAIDRSALAEVVFNDPEELAALEEITHPHIFDTIKARVEELRGVVVVEIPVMRHSMGSEWNRIVVDSRDEVRLQRATERGMPEADSRARLSSQPSRAEWLAIASVVVPNHGSIENLASAVELMLPML